MKILVVRIFESNPWLAKYFVIFLKQFLNLRFITFPVLAASTFGDLGNIAQILCLQ